MSRVPAFLLLMGCLHFAHQHSISSSEFESTFKTKLTPTESPTNPEKPCECVPYYLCSDNTTINMDAAGIFNVRIDDEDDPHECPSYLQICCQKPSIIKEKILSDPLPLRKGCGFRHEDGVGFKIDSKHDEAKFGEFPWVVAVLNQEFSIDGSILSTYKCGGALIHSKAVLTAAHCIGNEKQLRVRAGEWDPQTNLEIFPHQEVAVKKVIIHPKFHSEMLPNDVALLILEKEIEFDDHIDVICLPPQGYVVGDKTECLASSWGKDAFEGRETSKVILNKLELPFVERDRCQEQLQTTRLGKYFILDKSLVCADGKEDEDACHEDEGSPIVCPIPGTTNRYLHAGIATWRIDCEKANIPGVYSNVALFRNWIDEQMISNNLDPSEYQY